MRNKNFDADLLKTLNEQPMPAAPLTDDEFARVLDAACAKLPQAKKTVKRRFPWGPLPWPSSCPWWAACSAG